MKRAISTHRRDFIAIIALLVAAIVVAGYILKHEPAFTFGNSYYTIDAQFSNASAVTAGQGQTIDIAGVEVGQVGGVRLEGGHAVVQMDLFKRYAPVYRNATVLLRPRTPLKDMYLELYPGTPNAGTIPAGGTLPVGATNPTVDFSEILSSLDSDTRDYLLLLLAGGSQAFHDRGANGELPSPGAVAHLRGVFKRFAPLNRDTRTFTRLLADRRQNIRRAIHGLEQVTTSLGSVQGQLTSLIDSSNTNFRAIASQASQLQSALTLLPPTLHESAVTFNKLRGFGQASTSSASRLLPWAHALAPALIAVRPLFRQTTPVIRHQLRPFSVAVQPVARILRPAAAALAQATPHLAHSLQILNALFNTMAYQPRGGAQSYLFWGSWLSHIAASLASQQDAQGPIVHGIFMASCSELRLFEVTLAKSTPAIGNLLALLNAPDFSTLPGNKNGTCPFG
jgi:phospholipid/cholesterol/gamma-HCH transport system substrate-binding protein